jgi:hypothetical protein
METSREFAKRAAVELRPHEWSDWIDAEQLAAMIAQRDREVCRDLVVALERAREIADEFNGVWLDGIRYDYARDLAEIDAALAKARDATVTMQMSSQ